LRGAVTLRHITPGGLLGQIFVEALLTESNSHHFVNTQGAVFARQISDTIEVIYNIFSISVNKLTSKTLI
jgi:hypothetical protein